MSLPSNWREVVAALTRFFGWSAHDWKALTPEEFRWWHGEAERMVAEAARG